MSEKLSPVVITDTPKLGDISRYPIPTYCGNCSDRGTAWIKKGTPKKGLTITCEKCGCEVEL